MKKCIFLTCVALLLAGTIFFTLGNTKTYAAATGDPYASGCAKSYAPVNGGTIEYAGVTIAWITNYYSYTCNTNWVYMDYNTSYVDGTYIDIHQKGVSISSAPSYSHQCYPTNCNSWYYGRLTPTWSDMVNGTPTDCIFVNLAIDPAYSVGSGPDFASTYSMYHTNDAICA